MAQLQRDLPPVYFAEHAGKRFALMWQGGHWRCQTVPADQILFDKFYGTLDEAKNEAARVLDVAGLKWTQEVWAS